MTTLPTFDPWAELARIRAEAPNLIQLSPALATPLPEVTSLANKENSATLATLATLAGPHRENAISADPPRWTADGWRETFEERLAVAMIDGEQPEREARRIAYQSCVVRWMDLHPAHSAPDRCAECGSADSLGNIVPYGCEPVGHTWLHPRCWGRWHARRLAEATAALSALGLSDRSAAQRQPGDGHTRQTATADGTHPPEEREILGHCNCGGVMGIRTLCLAEAATNGSE